MCWTRLPQERSGTYMFAGRLYVTCGVCTRIPFDEILFIYQDVRAFAEEQGGIDWIQVYQSCEGDKLFFVDSLSPAMLESGDFENEDNCCTLMFASEY